MTKYYAAITIHSLLIGVGFWTMINGFWIGFYLGVVNVCLNTFFAALAIGKIIKHEAE